ncbi:hypothetical protein Bhyg_17132 [Pseudolycoriella hygida]|uniref:CHK kinase-like domain-containing protein n=1 Tax=Pseudolycoriella hygida TaxID=35572 RepID=A0A9Q0MJ93_9DIPT|nr:hypothetical protein Bhyg_17132 [Pseudolycoriella hygida]
MYRVKVDFSVPTEVECEEPTVHLIVKAAIAELEEALTTFDVYKKEVEFYNKIVPKFNEKLKDLNESQLLPECFGVCAKRKIMVIEDLNARGYNILPGQNKCNIPETKAILKRTAAFNAIGAILRQDQPDIFTTFTSSHLSRDVSVFTDMYSGMYDALLDTVSSWSDFSKYHEKMIRFREHFVEKVHQALDVNPEHFNALVHNDLWPPNIMVKDGGNSSEEEPFESITFIDFQNTLWGSPTVDLHLFLNMSVSESYKPNRFDELVEFHHSQLVNYLHQLKYKGHIPTWSEFHSQYLQRNVLAFVATCMEQAITIGNTGDVVYNDLIKNDEKSMKIKRQLYQKPTVQIILRKMIPFYDQIGTFD